MLPQEKTPWRSRTIGKAMSPHTQRERRSIIVCLPVRRSLFVPHTSILRAPYVNNALFSVSAARRHTTARRRRSFNIYASTEERAKAMATHRLTVGRRTAYEPTRNGRDRPRLRPSLFFVPPIPKRLFFSPFPIGLQPHEGRRGEIIIETLPFNHL